MSKKPVRVVFADLDGTLLNKSHTVSAFTLKVLQRLRAERPAVKFVVATGRPYQSVMESMKLLDLHPDYIISNNGAVVHQGGTDARISHHTLSADVIARLLTIPLPCVAAEGESADAVTQVPVVAANLYREQGWLTTAKVAGLGRTYPPSFQPHVVADLPQRHDLHQQAYSLFFYGPNEYLLPIERVLQEKFADDATFSFSLPYILDVAPREVDKGTAVRDVLRLLDCTADEAAAFGDGMNDLPMLSAVGHPYLMANSFPALLAAAPEMEKIGSHDEDGVAQKLNQLFFPEVTQE